MKYLQEIINTLEDALKDYNKALYLSDKRRIDQIRTKVQIQLNSLPQEYLYLDCKKTFYNHSRLEDDLPDLIDELKFRL